MPSDSESSTTGDQKRRTEEELGNLFKKSRKISRTPTKSNETKKSEDMEEIKGMFRTLMGELNEIRNEQKSCKKEMEAIKEENKELREKINTMQKKIEKIEKQDKKNNIIVKGIEFQNIDKIKKAEEFIESKMKIKVKVVHVRKIETTRNNHIAILKLSSWEDKKDIMSHKSALKGADIYIEDDYTKEERDIQTKIRLIAREEKNKGKNVKMGYRKLIMNREVWEWNDMENKLTKRKIEPKN